jgi:WD40 repeat protein
MLIKLWNWEKIWACQRVFEGHTHYVMQIVFNPKDNNTFASASLDRMVKVCILLNVKNIKVEKFWLSKIMFWSNYPMVTYNSIIVCWLIIWLKKRQSKLIMPVYVLLRHLDLELFFFCTRFLSVRLIYTSMAKFMQWFDFDLIRLIDKKNLA